MPPIPSSVTSSINPISNPGAHDLFKVDKLFSPFSRIVECNGREYKWQEQQAPGFTGAFVVFRGEALVSVTYGIEIIDKPGFATKSALLSYVAAKAKRRPPEGMKLIDLRLADMRIPQVALARLPWMETVEPGHWIYKIKFQEYKRLQLAGGPVQAPRSKFEGLLDDAKNRLEASTNNARDALAGARAARGERARRNPHVPSY